MCLKTLNPSELIVFDNTLLMMCSIVQFKEAQEGWGWTHKFTAITVDTLSLPPAPAVQQYYYGLSDSTLFSPPQPVPVACYKVSGSLWSASQVICETLNRPFWEIAFILHLIISRVLRLCTAVPVLTNTLTSEIANKTTQILWRIIS